MCDANKAGFSEIIIKMKDRKMLAIVYNRSCPKCGNIPIGLICVGALTICEKCFLEEFSTEDPVHNERETYMKWLKKQTEDSQKVLLGDKISVFEGEDLNTEAKNVNDKIVSRTETGVP